MTLFTILLDKEMRLDNLQLYVKPNIITSVFNLQHQPLFPWPHVSNVDLGITRAEGNCDNIIPWVHFTI